MSGSLPIAEDGLVADLHSVALAGSEAALVSALGYDIAERASELLRRMPGAAA